MKKVVFVITLVYLLVTLLIAMPVAASPADQIDPPRTILVGVEINTTVPPPTLVGAIALNGPLYYVRILRRDGSY